MSAVISLGKPGVEVVMTDYFIVCAGREHHVACPQQDGCTGDKKGRKAQNVG
jgi:hypothetical protein